MSLPKEDDEPRWIVLFDSIHDVLAAEQVFQERQIGCDLVPIPRDLSANCGMAIVLGKGDLDVARTVLADPRVKPRGIYQYFP